jgi:FHS family glucose/mannose:H+ symporter-like MFS transporter
MPHAGSDHRGTQPSSSRVLFVCACLCLVTFGVVLTTLGAVLPSVMERFGIDKASAGGLLFLMTFGILAGALVFGPVVDRHGYKAIVVTATALIAVALEGVAFAPSMIWLRVSVFLTGFGGGIINGSANALVSDISGEERGPRLNFLAVFFGVGAAGVPFLLAILTGRFSEVTLLAGAGGVVLLPLVMIAMTRFPPSKHAQGFPIVAAGRLLRDPLTLLMGVMLFLQSGMEITVGGWTSTFAKEELAVSERSGLLLLSLYWTGMMLGRVVIAAVLGNVSPFRVLYSCLTIALTGAAMLLATHDVGVAALAVFLVGLGFAAMFPTVLGFIGNRYPALSGTAFSAAFVMALTGGMVLPYTAGVLGDAFGMRTSFLIVPTALLILAALLGILNRALRRA